jgi:hypothetical protein
MTDMHDEAFGRELVARTEFNGESIWLPMLAVHHLNAGQTVITGKTFTDCLIEGPAVMVAIKDVALDGCNMGVTSNPMNLMFKPLGDMIIGAVGVADCRFIRCRFVQVGFTGPEVFLKELAESMNASAGENGVSA